MERQDMGISRRRVMHLGALSVGAAVLGSATAMPAFADVNGAGEDGAPAGDPRFSEKFAQSKATMRTSSRVAAAAAVETSYNGWPVGTPASSISVSSIYAPGTSILIPVRSGDVATVLMYVAGRFNAEVETLRAGQVWGYDYRKNVNNPAVWSNHASGTAIDLNSALHPNGAKNTFSAAQVRVIRDILAVCGDVIYWGGDYRGTTDEMHFEIDVPPGDRKLSTLAARIRGGVSAPGSGGAIYHDGRYDIFGIGIDNGMYQATSYNGTNYSEWVRPVGGLYLYTPAALYHDGRYDLFGIGLNGSPYHTHWYNGWSEINNLGGGFQGGLSATYHDGRYDLWGIGTDGFLYQSTSNDGSNFSVWQPPVGGGFKSTPAALYHGGQYDIFALGSDGAMYRMTWFDGWRQRVRVAGRPFSGGLSATYNDGRYDVFGVGTDGVLYQNVSTDGNSYSGWLSPIGGGFQSTPIATLHDGRYDLYLRGASTSMYHCYWFNGWSKRVDLGGRFLA